MTDVAEINPLDLPSVPLEDRKNLPDRPAIYFVLDSNDAVLYVGRATSLARRWVAHHRTKQLREGGPTRIAWLEVSDSALLDEIERACIAHFAPILNGAEGGCRTKKGERWVQVRLSEADHLRLKEWATRDSTSVSYLLRRLAERALRQDEDKTGGLP